MADNSMSDRELRRLTRGFGVLHSVLRLRILSTLAQGESNVRNLEAKLRVSQPLLSWHLTQLRQAGFVSAERVGREVRYRLQPAAFRDLIVRIENVLGFSLVDETD